MPEKTEKKARKMIVVEEVKSEEQNSQKETAEKKPQILDEAAKTASDKNPAETIDTPTESAQEEIIPEKRQISPVFWIIIPGIFILGAILGGIIFYQKGVNKGEAAVATPTPAAIASPAATGSAEIDLTKYTISILNGSGIAGEAGRAKTLLTKAGFEVGTPTNAASYDYTKTIIKAKETVEEAFLTKLTSTLNETYVVDEVQTLGSSSSAEVQIVIGSTKAD
jgi:hypothetical protein